MFMIFRWNMPEFVNGPVIGFTVQCWFIIDDTEVQLCESVNVPVSQLGEMDANFYSFRKDRSIEKYLKDLFF